MRVLVADDQPQVRSALRLLLEQELDIQVVDEVTNAKDLLVQARSSVPDVLLLDWELPGLPSSTLLDTLRRGLPYLSIIALSGKWEARRLALAAGADAFVSKTEPSDRLLRALREIARSDNKMVNTILVPLDGSERAETILPHAKEIAQRYQARVILLQVVEVPSFGSGGSPKDIPAADCIERHISDAQTYLAIRLNKFREAGINAESEVVQGPVVQSIIDIAKREHADLIAMASHGRSGLSRVFYGSVAAGVLHRVDRPLLLVRAR